MLPCAPESTFEWIDRTWYNVHRRQLPVDLFDHRVAHGSDMAQHAASECNAGQGGTFRFESAKTAEGQDRVLAKHTARSLQNSRRGDITGFGCGGNNRRKVGKVRRRHRVREFNQVVQIPTAPMGTDFIQQVGRFASIAGTQGSAQGSTPDPVS